MKSMRNHCALPALVMLAGGVLLVPVARAAVPPLPAAVAAAVKEFADICRDVEGKPDTREAVKRADLNGDGIEDYVVDVAGIVCTGAWSIFGDREKSVSVYVGDGKGAAVRAFSDTAYGASLEVRGKSTQLWLTVSGVECGRKPARDFASESFCDRSLVWNAAARRFDYAPLPGR
jgi:hypothetical protein